MAKLDVDRLESLGFFRFVDPAHARHVAERIRATGYPFADDVHRHYMADAEELAEHGVRDFLGTVAPLLRHLGVRIDVEYAEVRVPGRDGGAPGREAARVASDGWLPPDAPLVRVASMRLALAPGQEPCDVTEDDFQESERYLVYLGAREHVVYDLEPGVEWNGWREAARSTIALLNDLLLTHGAAERAYAENGGNDMNVVFVTPEMAKIINVASGVREALHDGSCG
jgi:hypothetical protein